jgi:peptidoglycan/LPS O-acetylase OafA/YrhL
MVVLEAMAHGLPVVVTDSRYCGIAGFLTNSENAVILSLPYVQRLKKLIVTRHMSMRNSNSEKSDHALTYRKDIDGLRALAVLSVVIYHAFPEWMHGGFVGVDVFFVISGFLITSIITQALDKGTFSFIDFYARRVRRIFPALLLILICCGLFGWYVLYRDEFLILAKHIAGGAIFVSNLVLMNESGYFDTEAVSKPLLHIWSLGIEEQFYLIWPLLLWIAHRLKIKRQILIISFATISFVTNMILIDGHPVAAFYLIGSRGWELLAGAWLACLHQPIHGHSKAFNFNARNWGSAFGVALLTFSLFWLTSSTNFPGWRALLPVVASVLILWSGEDAWINRTLLGQPLLRRIGLISYPLYLWHWPLLSFAGILGGGAIPWPIRFAMIVLAFVLAELTYQGIEKPVRHSSANPKLLRRPTFWLSMLMVCVAVVSIIVANSNAIFGEPTTSNAKNLFATNKACQDKYQVANSGFCEMSDSSKKFSALLLGDSHAAHLYPGLREPFSKENLNLVKIGDGNCYAFLGIDTILGGQRKHCEKIFDHLIPEVANDPNVKMIILSSFAIAGVSGGFHYHEGKRVQLLDLEPGHSDTVDSSKSYLLGLGRTLRFFENAGKPVVLVLDNPELDFDPRQCQQSRPLSFSQKGDCTVPRDMVEKRMGRLREQIAAVASLHPNVRVFDPMTVLCDDRRCNVIRDGNLIYLDKDHLSAFGSNLLGAKLASFIFLQ